MIKINKVDIFNPLSANPTKWPNTFKPFAGNLATNCLSVFGHFVKLALKGLTLDHLEISASALATVSASALQIFFSTYEKMF